MSALVCLVGSRHADDWTLRWGLRALAGGWLLNAVPWLLNLVWLRTGDERWIAYFGQIDGVSALCLVAGTALPLVSAAHVAIREVGAYRRLHPVWRALTADVPDVVLGTAGSTPISLLWGASPRTAVDRHLVEIRDAMRDLRGYVDADAVTAARAQAEDVDSAGTEAFVMAWWLHTAQRAKRAGRPPRAHTIDITGAGGDRADEIRFLHEVARAYRDPRTHDTARNVSA